MVRHPDCGGNFRRMLGRFFLAALVPNWSWARSYLVSRPVGAFISCLSIVAYFGAPRLLVASSRAAFIRWILAALVFASGVSAGTVLIGLNLAGLRGVVITVVAPILVVLAGLWLLLDAAFRSAFDVLRKRVPSMSVEDLEEEFRRAGKSRAADIFRDELQRRGVEIQGSASPG
jgi:hypothetical protein